METIEEIKNCPCDQLTVIKRGFNINKALHSLLYTIISLVVIWFVIITKESSDNKMDADIDSRFHLSEIGVNTTQPEDLEDNKLAIGVSIFLVVLSFTGGFVDANKKEIICLKCGKVKELPN